MHGRNRPTAGGAGPRLAHRHARRRKAAIEQLAPRTSFLQYLPHVHRYYRYLLPVMPAAAAAWRIRRADLIVSFSHCVAKAVKPPAGAAHVCYCFTPMRYAWHMRESYFAGRVAGLKAKAVAWLLAALRDWDQRTAERVTHFIAISQTVQRRILECYGRPSEVIYPPVDTDFYTPAPYKRIDLAIDACNRLGRHLVIIGEGQDETRLRSLAGPTVRFLGWQSDAVIRDHFRRCRALLFPGEEDFGIVPVEAQACGTPVIAFGRGGATETVIPLGGRREPTGLWFEEQSADSLIDAMSRFEVHAGQFEQAAARKQAVRFNQGRFADELFAYVDGVLQPARAAPRRAA